MSSESIGKSVQLFLVDGTPGGLVTAGIMNWTGHILAAPRSKLSSLLKRQEAKRTGVYILLGDDPEGLGRPQAYIGESDDVSKRLIQHASQEPSSGKDFWNRAVTVTGKDAGLTKAHARYLESQFITLARTVNRAQLTNSNAPDLTGLPEADRSGMQYFIEQVEILLPILGVNIFRSTSEPTTVENATPDDSNAPASPLFELTFHKEGVKATAQEIDSEFTVREGSTARKRWVGTALGSYRALRDKLEADGTLVPAKDGTLMRFTRDHVFTSPSAAAAVILGRSANGRSEWKEAVSGTSFGEWQSRNIDTSVGKEGHQ